jgi:tetratricopeptide (TPR) repeat protein
VGIVTQSPVIQSGKGFAMDQKAEDYQRGKALIYAGRYAECDPHAKEVQVAVASTVDRLGLFRKAILCCEQAIGEDNQFCDAWFIKDLAHFRLSEYRKSGACFQQLLNNDCTHAEAWFMKGNSHYYLLEPDEAIGITKQSVSRHSCSMMSVLS